MYAMHDKLKVDERLKETLNPLASTLICHYSQVFPFTPPPPPPPPPPCRYSYAIADYIILFQWCTYIPLKGRLRRISTLLRTVVHLRTLQG